MERDLFYAAMKSIFFKIYTCKVSIQTCSVESCRDLNLKPSGHYVDNILEMYPHTIA